MPDFSGIANYVNNISTHAALNPITVSNQMRAQQIDNMLNQEKADFYPEVTRSEISNRNAQSSLFGAQAANIPQELGIKQGTLGVSQGDLALKQAQYNLGLQKLRGFMNIANPGSGDTALGGLPMVGSQVQQGAAQQAMQMPQSMLGGASDSMTPQQLPDTGSTLSPQTLNAAQAYNISKDMTPAGGLVKNPTPDKSMAEMSSLNSQPSSASQNMPSTLNSPDEQMKAQAPSIMQDYYGNREKGKQLLTLASTPGQVALANSLISGTPAQQAIMKQDTKDMEEYRAQDKASQDILALMKRYNSIYKQIPKSEFSIIQRGQASKFDGKFKELENISQHLIGIEKEIFSIPAKAFTNQEMGALQSAGLNPREPREAIKLSMETLNDFAERALINHRMALEHFNNNKTVYNYLPYSSNDYNRVPAHIMKQIVPYVMSRKEIGK